MHNYNYLEEHSAVEWPARIQETQVVELESKLDACTARNATRMAAGRKIVHPPLVLRWTAPTASIQITSRTYRAGRHVFVIYHCLSW